jgi:cytochrome c oxidase cbb3-type subunit III
MARLTLLLCALLLAACEREERAFRPDPMTQEAPQQISLSKLSPGSQPPQEVTRRDGNTYESNAYHVNQGKTLYTRFNCNGCHSNGGGGMGPALMDDKWIYGSRIENIVATIQEGRPNGMPSFRGRIPEDQVWQIAAYVRSMSGQLRKDVAPSRNDSMNAGPSENRRARAEPKDGGTPPAPQ